MLPNEPVKKRILVTGAAGLLGQALLKQLCVLPAQIIGVFHNTKPQFEHPYVTYIKGNILDVNFLEAEFKNVIEVYHCAAVVSFEPRQAEHMFKLNIEGTANVVNAALLAGVRKLVHVSSVAVLPATVDGMAITEEMFDDHTKLTGSYAKSKFFAEIEVWRAMAEGLNAAIINPSVILGAGDWEDGSTKLFENAYNEFPWYTNGGTGVVDVADVAKAMIMLMESDVESERFIISAENRLFKDLFTKMANAFGKKPPRKKASPFITSLVWRAQKLTAFFTGRPVLITRETAESAQKIRTYNNNKFLQAFPQFAYKPIDESIADICAVLQQKVNKP